WPPPGVLAAAWKEAPTPFRRNRAPSQPGPRRGGSARAGAARDPIDRHRSRASIRRGGLGLSSAWRREESAGVRALGAQYHVANGAGSWHHPHRLGTCCRQRSGPLLRRASAELAQFGHTTIGLDRGHALRCDAVQAVVPIVAPTL